MWFRWCFYYFGPHHHRRCWCCWFFVSYAVRSRKVTLYKFSPNDIELNVYRILQMWLLLAYIQAAESFLHQMTNVKRRRYHDTILCVRFRSSFQLYWNQYITFSLCSFSLTPTLSGFVCLLPYLTLIPSQSICICVLFGIILKSDTHNSTQNLYFVVKSLRLLNAFKSGF